MPHGIQICLELRELIYRYFTEFNYSVAQIHASLFNGDVQRCSIEYLTKLCNKLNSDEDFAEGYLLGGRKTPGRPLSLPYFERSLIRERILHDKHLNVSTMYRNYCDMFYPAENDNEVGPHRLSLSTFKRSLKRNHLTRKVMGRRHINQNPAEGVQYLEAIEHIDPINIIDVKCLIIMLNIFELNS